MTYYAISLLLRIFMGAVLLIGLIVLVALVITIRDLLFESPPTRNRNRP